MGVHVLGIRHHGPGSARSVAAALNELQPDLVIIEGAPELADVLPWANSDQLVPPVAGLVYDPADPTASVFYPLASFSPEWVAMRWAAARGTAIRFADLPAANSLALEQRERESSEEADSQEPESEQPEPEPEPDQTGITNDHDEPGHPCSEQKEPYRPDVISTLAYAAGYDEPERWWEDAIEHRHDSALGDFAALLDAVRLVREGEELDEETARREAAMRRIIREAMTEHEDIVIVCGAFHAPVLQPGHFPSAASDNKVLAKLPKTKVAATWAPWTTKRLSYASGYGAGVNSPGWYSHLFDQWSAGSTDTGTTWMVRVAHNLRSAQFDAAPASVVDATRLAETLAALRGRPSVGLAELNDSALVTLVGGSDLPMQMIREELVIGTDLGRVPDDVPMVPLAQDLAKQQKSLRLKPQALASEVVLDLRKDSGIGRSQLFHRLNLLDIPWGVEQGGVRTTGTFKEIWTLEWQPEFAVRLIEAGVYGTTVAAAAAGRVRERAAGSESVAPLAELVEESLLADLTDALPEVISRLEQIAARHTDEAALLSGIQPLARTVRYGNVRDVDLSELRNVVTAMVARACVGLRPACLSLDDDSATQMRAAIESAHSGITLLDDEQLLTPWLKALAGITSDNIHGLVAGRATRVLLDAGRISTDEVSADMSRRLSPAYPAVDSAAWLDGFLSGDVSLMLLDDSLLRLIDAWLAATASSTFDDVLPLLRRTFSRYQPAERRDIGERVATLDGTPQTDVAADASIDLALAEPAMLRVAELLGLQFEVSPAPQEVT